MPPLAALRVFLQKNEHCQSIATQAGFAQFTGHSESHLRAVEKGRAKMSRKFAQRINDLLGVDEDWLMQKSVKGLSVPLTSGEELTHLQAASKIDPLPKSATKFDPQKFIQTFSTMQEPGTSEDPPENQTSTVTVTSNLNPAIQQMMERVMGMVHDELDAYYENPKSGMKEPLSELFNWAMDRASKRSNLTDFQFKDEQPES